MIIKLLILLNKAWLYRWSMITNLFFPSLMTFLQDVRYAALHMKCSFLQSSNDSFRFFMCVIYFLLVILVVSYLPSDLWHLWSWNAWEGIFAELKTFRGTDLADMLPAAILAGFALDRSWHGCTLFSSENRELILSRDTSSTSLMLKQIRCGNESHLNFRVNWIK